MNIFKISALTALILLGFQLFAQDQIIKTNGDEISGKVTRISPLDIFFKKKDNMEGPEYSELKSNILFIKYENGTKEILTVANTPVINNMSTLCTPIKRKNSIFFDGAGNGIILSINYERKFFGKKSNNFGTVKVGIGPLGTLNILNFTGTYNIGDGMNFFEIGGGFGSVANISNSYRGNRGSFISPENYFYFTPTLGFRRQSSSGFLFRAYLTMLTIQEFRENFINSSIGYSYYYNIERMYYPFLGISLGYSF